MENKNESGYFKSCFNLEERIKKQEELQRKYPSRIPIICEKAKNSTLQPLEESQFLAPEDMIGSQFIFLIRRKLNLHQSSAFFLLIDGKVLLTGNDTMKQIYNKYKDKEDGFLYITIANENVWG